MNNDLRYAWRTLTKSPGFVVTAVLTLALGIGANTAIFSVVNGVLLRPLPFGDADRIVRVWTSTASDPQSSHSAGDFADIRNENQSLAAIAGVRNIPFTVVARPGEPVMLEGAFVTVDFFDVLGVRAPLGRTFSRATDAPSSAPVVVLTDRAWEQLFSRNPAAVGEQLRIDGEAHTVLGVLPPHSEWPENARLFVLSSKPVPPSPVDRSDALSERDVRYFDAIARIKPGLSLEEARQDVHRVALSIERRHPGTAAGRDIRLVPLREEIVGDVRAALLVLQFAVGLVLLIACANVSSLLIARASGRRRELAIRAALGAGRIRLVRQLLTESLLLGVAGGLAGLLIGSWLLPFLVRMLPAAVPRADNITLDRVVAFSTLMTALVTGALFGVLPALQGSRADNTLALKQSGDRGTAERARGRAALVVAQVALTLVLLSAAGLLLNSFLRLQGVDSGMRPDSVTFTGLVLPQSRYPSANAQTAVYRRLIEALEQRSGILAVGVGFPGPLRGSNASGAIFIEGHQTTDRSDQPFTHLGSVSGGYFAAAGIPLAAGRIFAASDTAGAPGVAIVSEAFVRKYWPEGDALGKRVRFDPNDPWMTVVGVVGDVRQLGLDQPAPPILYLPYEQFPLPFSNLAVRSAAPADAVAALVRSELASIDPDLPPGNLATLQTLLDRSVEQPRFRSFLLGAFAILALALAAVGIAGLISFSVAQRTREIGIRIALGAAPRQVLSATMREGLVLIVCGMAIGVGAAALSSRVLGTFLFGVDATDLSTFAGAAVVLLTVSLMATYVPSRRALRVDPIRALRTE